MANIIASPLDDFFRGFFIRPVDFGSDFGAENTIPNIRIDIKENNGVYTVHAELPGVKKEDIQVHIDGKRLTLTAERKQENSLKDGERILRTECFYGKVSRTLQLDQDIDEAQATAKFIDGILDLTLPKKSTPQARQLIIE